MVKHLTPLDIMLWQSILVVCIFTLKKIGRKFITLSFVLIYIMLESVIEAAFLFTDIFKYKQIYYLLGIIECLVLSLCAVQLSGSLISKLKDKVLRWGPIVVAIPTFCIYVILHSSDLHKEVFVDKVLRISELAFISSLSLLFICIAFEDENAKTKTIARSFAFLLAILIACAELQLKFGLVMLVRKLWLICWLVGLSGVAYSCRSIGKTKSMFTTNGGVE